MRYSSIYKVITRTICVEFYRLNTGFFFVVIAFSVGLLRPVEHIALVTYFVHSYSLLALLFGIWTLYCLKTVQFTLRAFALEENLFLNHLFVLPFSIKYMALLLVQFILFEPVVLYTAFMGYYAVHYHQYMALVMLILFNILSIGGAAAYYLYRLRFARAEVSQSRLGQYLNRSFTKPYFTFFLYHLLNKQFSLFWLTKIFSLLLITATVKLYSLEDYSSVLLSLGILIAFSANAVLVFHFNHFEQVSLQLFKNMPLSASRHYVYNILTYLCVLVPEILLLLRYLTGDIPWIIACKLLFFGLSLQLMLHSYILYRQLDLEKFIRHIFFIVIFFFVCILFRVDLFLLAFFNLTASYLIYRKYFYMAEVVVLNETREE
jgi:hypothetical protein